jgi:hypothetical protein
MDDVGTGAVKLLTACDDVTELLGLFSLTDPVAPNGGRPWIFADTISLAGAPGVLTRVEGTQQAALVLSDFGGWEAPAMLASARFRRLRVDVWVDPVRDGNNNVAETSALTTNRGLAVFAAAHSHLQRRDSDVQVWGDLVTFGCQLLADITFSPVPDGDWLQRGTAYYGVYCAGWTDAAE